MSIRLKFERMKKGKKERNIGFIKFENKKSSNRKKMLRKR